MVKGVAVNRSKLDAALALSNETCSSPAASVETNMFSYRIAVPGALPDLQRPLDDLYPQPRQRRVATTRLALLLKTSYQPGHWDAQYTHLEVTTQKMLGTQVGIVCLARWPGSLATALASRGLTEQLCRDRHQKMVVVRFVDVKQAIVFVLPRAKPAWLDVVTPPPTQDVRVEPLQSLLTSIYTLQGQCHNCKVGSKGERPTLMKCSRCLVARYCGSDCQRADWNRHKRVCEELQSMITQSTPP